MWSVFINIYLFVYVIFFFSHTTNKVKIMYLDEELHFTI